jgi:hypothetical protein
MHSRPAGPPAGGAKVAHGGATAQRLRGAGGTQLRPRAWHMACLWVCDPSRQIRSFHLRLAQRWVRAVGHALLPRHEVERIASAQRSDAGHGYDAFGMHRDWLVLARALLGPLYGRYFRVSSFGSEHIPRDGPAILIANHAGTLPIDAAMICLDVAEHTQPPRMPRIVVDRFVPRMPVFGSLASRVGAVSGTPGNVRHLLENGELCLIFP